MLPTVTTVCAVTHNSLQWFRRDWELGGGETLYTLALSAAQHWDNVLRLIFWRPVRRILCLPRSAKHLPVSPENPEGAFPGAGWGGCGSTL